MQQEDETRTIPQLVEEVRAGRLARRRLMKALAALGLSAAGVSTISASTAHPAPSSQQAPLAQPEDQPNKNLQLHDQHLANQTQGDTGALHQDYAEDAVVEDSMYAQSFVGKASIMARKGIGMAAIPNLQIHVTNRVAHGKQVMVEWTATGSHTGDFPDLPASGRPFSIRGVTVVVRHKGKIVREAIYYDMQEVRRQLGHGEDIRE